MRTLIPLLCAVAVAALAWTLVTPPFLIPDEAEHFAYVQSLAENGERPPAGEVYAREDRLLSGEQTAALYYSRTWRHIELPGNRPAWEDSARRAFEPDAARQPRDNAAAVGVQARHPPLYYGYEVVPYAIGAGGDVFDRVFLMRLWSALLLLVTTAGAWLLIGELTGRDRLLQLAGSACVGLQPMVTFISAGVNPDALLFACFSLALWLAVRLLRGGVNWPAVAGLAAVTVAACLTKPAGLALVPLACFAIAFVTWPHVRRPRAAVAAGAVALAAAGVATARVVEDRLSHPLEPAALRGFSTYLWDFYLPRLPFQAEYPALQLDNPAWTVWVKHAWASFGFLEVQFPAAVYVPLAAVAAGTFAAAAIAVARSRFAIERRVLVAFGLVAACLLLGLHWMDYDGVRNGARVIQGRYLLPLMPIAGVAVAAALSNLTRRRDVGVAAVLGALAVLQLCSLAVVTGRYFA